MKIKSIVIENFRGYRNKTTISFESLTALVGRNDSGKTTILEALDVFFSDGKGRSKLTSDDINIENKILGKHDIKISVCFDELPEKIVIDTSNETKLSDEYLLSHDKDLVISKTFKNASTNLSNIKISIRAYHPTNPNCANLLLKKQESLLEIINLYNLPCKDKRKNACLRTAIWDKFKQSNTLQLKDIEIDVNSKDGDIKEIWSKLQSHLPCYSLFKSDRENSDEDSEIQDPLKETVKQIINEPHLQEQLDKVAEEVRNKIQDVANLTLDKIKKMDREIADTLHPRIPLTKDLRWADVFKGLSITGDDDIPINKRGSGVKRLILLNFFRAEAERKQKLSGFKGIIYAIEEPETSQHKQYQRMLIDTLKTLSEKVGVQVILTTHSSDIVKQLRLNQIRLISEVDGEKRVVSIPEDYLPYRSLNEVNYLAFGDISEEYHNELYGFLQDQAIKEASDNSKEKNFDKWLVAKGCRQNKQWSKPKKSGSLSIFSVTVETYIRNFIHHPENENNKKYTDDELKHSINEMRRIAHSYFHQQKDKLRKQETN